MDSVLESPDILLLHEAPSPFFKHDKDIGQPILRNLLKRVKPGICFFGHHHKYMEMDYDDIKVIALEYASQSFVLYDPETNILERRHPPAMIF